VRLLLAHVLRDARRMEEAEALYRQLLSAAPASAASAAADGAETAGSNSGGDDRAHALHALKAMGVDPDIPVVQLSQEDHDHE
jgi:hypothetical protein